MHIYRYIYVYTQKEKGGACVEVGATWGEAFLFPVQIQGLKRGHQA